MFRSNNHDFDSAGHRRDTEYMNDPILTTKQKVIGSITLVGGLSAWYLAAGAPFHANIARIVTG